LDVKKKTQVQNMDSLLILEVLTEPVMYTVMGFKECSFPLNLCCLAFGGLAQRLDIVNFVETLPS
jgi:hypothetical protein